MRVHICGVRGSTPSPGPDFVRYGGHTSCVALSHDGEAPSLILDAGTGLRRVTALLGGVAFHGGAPFHGAVLLGHLHWDHTQGLPFFAAGDRPDARVRLCLPAQGDPVEVLGRFMSPPHFPIPPTELRGTWSFEGLDPGGAEFEGFTVLALEIPHKGGRTYGFRVSDGTGTIAYLSDHSPVSLGPGPHGLGPYHDAAAALAEGADLVFHDAQHTAEELPARAAFGHSAAEYAVGLAETAGARAAVLFHHDPNRTDDQMDALLRALPPAKVEVTAAREGTVLQVGH